MKQQSFSAHGKLLLTSEYFVLDGAQAIALPTRFGQKMEMFQSEGEGASVLTWQAFEPENICWLDVEFDLENFDIVKGNGAEILQMILRAARSLNPDFLTEGGSVKTFLEFSKNWGLGSSSTLVCMLAAWANTDPFELLHKTIGGSGYDIACAGADTPILYHLNEGQPSWRSTDFNPSFHDSLYFIYLNEKQSSREAIDRYRKLDVSKSEAVVYLSDLSAQMLNTTDINEFESCLKQHEVFIAQELQLTCVQERLFSDYWGQIKSLGAWGGDFILATSVRPEQETRDYFTARGYKTVLNYTDMIL